MFSTSEGYHEYIGEGDIMSTLGDVQYIGGYHDACRDTMSASEDIMSTSGFSIEIEMIYQLAPPHAS